MSVLRAYAFFLQDIKDDQEQAEFLFQIADEIEDTAAKARRRREARKAAAARAKAGQPAREVRVTVADSLQPEDGPRAEGQSPLAQQVERSEDTASERSTSTMESSAAAVERSDKRNKLLQYRARITSAKSRTVNGLWLAILLSFAVMFALVVIAFTMSVIDAESMKEQATLVSATEDTQHRLTQAFMHIRLYRRSLWDFTSREWLVYVIDSLKDRYKLMQDSKDIWPSLANMIEITRFAPGRNDNFSDGSFWMENMSMLSAVRIAVAVTEESFLQSAIPTLSSSCCLFCSQRFEQFPTTLSHLLRCATCRRTAICSTTSSR